MKYTQFIELRDREYEITTATIAEEAKVVLSAGFEYFTKMIDITLFRNPKGYVGIGS